MSQTLWIAVGVAVAVLGALRAAFSPCGQSMLASLTPYAEAARGSRWAVTAAAFSLGAVLAGAGTGAGWGLIGGLLPPGQWRLVAAGVVLLLALVIDATPLRRRLPLVRRQVNEDWMVTYRGWVYGIGFGAQLGCGLITLVACAAIYASFGIELLASRPLTGLVIGAAFGATKAASLLPAGRARDSRTLIRLHRRLLALESLSVSAVVAGELLAVLILASALT